jgi:hypothetical protein
VTEVFQSLIAAPSLQALNDTLPFLERYTVIINDQTSTCTSVNTARTDLFTRKGRDIDNIPMAVSSMYSFCMNRNFRMTKNISESFMAYEATVVFAGLDIGLLFLLSPSRRREAPCEGTNSHRLFTPGETKTLAESKVDQISRAWVTNDGWSSSLISKIWRTVMNSGH